MENDADRLETIKALGGQLVQVPAGDFWALFDEEGVQVPFESIHINSNSPQITMLASDAKRLQLERNSQLEIANKQYTIREASPAQAPGWASYILDAE